MRASKFFALIIAIFSFTIISFISLSNGYTVDPLSFSSFEKGTKQVVSEDGTIKLEDISKEIENTDLKDKFFVNNLSILDSVYYNIEGQTDFKVDDSEKGNAFNIGSGVYGFMLNDINQTQKIIHEGFLLEPLSTGKLYIDSRNPRKTLIYSADMVLNIKLKDITDTKEVTEFVMYPHSLFTLNITRNKFLKDADLLRISTIFNISYIPDSIFGTKGVIDSNSLKLFGADKDNISKEFLNILASILNFKEKQVTSEYENIKNLEVAGLKDEALVDKYEDVFVNNDKKIVYLKNKILKNINLLFAEEGEVDENLKNEIIADFEEIKSINKDEYTKMLEILNGYYNILVHYNSLELFPNKLALSKIIEKIEGNENAFNEKYMYINAVFSSYDTDKIEKKQLYKYISDLLDKYYFDNKEEIIGGEYNKKTLESFSFLFTKMFENNFDLSPDYAMSNLDLLQKYIKINNFLLVASDKSTKKTYLYIYDELFRKFIDNFYENSFESKRDDKDLLVLKDYKNDEVYDLFKDVVYTGQGSIYRFIARHAYLFSDDIQRKDFDKYKDVIKEYFAAKDDYDLYIQNYYEPAKNLASTDIVGSKKDYSLSLEKFEDYFNQFKGVSYNLSNLEIDAANEKYHLSGLEVNGRTIDFDFYPYQRNKIDNFTVNGVKENFAYKLDNIKTEWDKKYQEETDYLKRQDYDFSLFFSNTFKDLQETKGTTYEKDETVVTDSKTEVVFKRDRLLGESGEFRSLKGYLNIDYEDIDLSTGKNNTYDIKLHDAILQKELNTANSGTLNFKINFNSDYIFTNSDHKFDNIKMYFYESRGNDEFFDSYTFGDEPIRINGSINITDFKTEVEKILNQTAYMVKLFNVIKQNYSSDLNIIYNINDLSFDVIYKDRQGRLVELKLDSNGKVSKFIVGGNNRITNPINISELYNLKSNNLENEEK